MILVKILAHRRPNWSTRKLILSAALPIPALGSLFSAYLYFRASLASPVECSMEGCWTLFAESYIVTCAALLTLAIGVISAWVFHKIKLP